MKRISISKDKIAQKHFAYNGPILDKKGNYRVRSRRQYDSIDALVNCVVSAFDLNIDKYIDVYIEGYSPEEIAYIKPELQSKFKREMLVNVSKC